MSQWWAVLMPGSGGLFVAGVVAIAWERVPAWRTSDPVEFRSGLAHTLGRVDRPQPALPPADVEALRARWLGGHLVRSAVALACFVLAVVATPRGASSSRSFPSWAIDSDQPTPDRRQVRHPRKENLS